MVSRSFLSKMGNTASGASPSLDYLEALPKGAAERRWAPGLAPSNVSVTGRPGEAPAGWDAAVRA
jgi:hypothetical protein